MATQAAPVPAQPTRRRARTAVLPSGPAPAPTTALVQTDSGMSPISTLQGLKWFAGKLTEQEQAQVTEDTIGLAQDLHDEAQSQIASGQRLARLQSILEPHNVFTRYLSHFHLNKRTAYRRIAKFKNAAQLPAPILELAMARNIPIGGDTEIKPFGAYTDAVRKLPPPKNPTQEQAATWLEQVQTVAKETRQSNADAAPGFVMPEPTDPNTAMKEAFRFVMNRYNQLPNNSRTRGNWMKGLFGMLMTSIGIGTPQQFAPQAVPEDFQVGRGRPRTAAGVQ